MKEIINNFAFFLFNKLHIQTMQFNEFYSIRTRRNNTGNLLLIACLPKSGSTYLSKSLAKKLNYSHDMFKTTGHQNDQDFFEPLIIDNYSKKVVIQQHLKASNANLELINKYEINTVVLTRNIFDIIVSFYDHLHNEAHEYWSMMFLDKSFFELSKEKKIDLVIDFLTPWVINFCVSWSRNKNQKQFWVTYEELITDENIDQKIITFFNCPVNTTEKNIGPDINFTRFNKGVVGRGKETLNEKQIQKITNYKTYYPNCDFSMIGL